MTAACLWGLALAHLWVQFDLAVRPTPRRSWQYYLHRRKWGNG